MNGESAYQRWWAAAGRWSRWTKPSLFAGAPEVPTASGSAWPAIDWLPAAPNTALVLDLPGPSAIPVAVALSQQGYCPVPMFNTTVGLGELIDTGPIVHALLGVAEALVMNAEGPPVFLIDHERHRYVRGSVGDYDNRWTVFTSDFPTTTFFAERGVKKLVVVTPRLGDDLHDSLSRHLAMEPTLLDPETRATTPFPPPRFVLWRGLADFGRSLSLRSGGTFGHRIQSSGG